MPVVMLLAAIAVLVGVFFAATGRGGELSRERADSAPLDLGPVSAADVALLRPPTAMWGYNVEVTDEALDVIARAMRDRDVTIAYLQQRLTETDPEAARTSPVPLVPRPLAVPPDTQAFQAPRDPPAAQVPAPGQDRADEEGLFPWDEPAAREDHPGYRDDRGAGESPAGQQDLPETAGE